MTYSLSTNWLKGSEEMDTLLNRKEDTAVTAASEDQLVMKVTVADAPTQ